MTPETAPKGSFLTRIPPEEAIVLAMLVLDALAEGWRTKRTALTARAHRAGRNLELALEREGGLRELLLAPLMRKL